MRIRIILLVLAAALTAAGCDKKDERSAAPGVPPVTAKDVQKASEATPALPPPSVAPADKGAPFPKPGQANDHSSPDFKGGGVTDPKK